MKITTKEVRDVNNILDEIIKDYKENKEETKRDWRTYEQRVDERLKKAFHELKPLVHEAVSLIKIMKANNRGNKSILNLDQKVLILLLKHLFGESNRDMSHMFVLFSWLTNIEISYKTVERLYSDDLVIIALHNLHILILKKKGITKADCGGDGTGYSLHVKEHYATAADKLKNKAKKNSKKIKFIFSFAMIDILTRMYICYGVGFKSEQEAFLNAISMTKEFDIEINSLRLDKYYSCQSYVELLNNNFGKVKMYLIPKKNATIKGSWGWKRMLHKFVNETKLYLEDYYKRNQSESGFSEDKKRTGWKLGQKREDRLETANKLTHLWHNLYWLG